MNGETSAKKQVPIGEGLFVLHPSPSQSPYLIGSKCRVCGEVFFPSRRRCRRCSSAELKDIALSRTARLYSFTKVRVNLPDAKVKSPLVGVVELPEGERIRTLLTDCTLNSLKIGDEVELIIDVVYEDESGSQVLAWKFRPVRRKQ